MARINWKKDVFTIPNLLSFLRLGLIPVYVVLYLRATTPAHYYLAGAILTVSCITDLVDGKIARKYGMISTLGMILDPIADKATQFALMLCLVLRFGAMLPLIFIFVAKELFQLVAGILALRQKKMLNGALWAGKICTSVLFVSLILLLVFPGIPVPVANGLLMADAVFLLASFLQYFFAYFGPHKQLRDL